MSTEELENKLRTSFLTTLDAPSHKNGCIFCKIAQGKEPRTNILFQNEAVCVFHDIRPATKEHLLIIPKTHHGSVKSLDKDQVPLLEYLHKVGEEVIAARGGNIKDSRVGFHWPPFYSIEHLHLHVIYPPNQMGFLGRLIFRANSYWFVTYEWALSWLQNKKDSSDGQTKHEPLSPKSSGTHI